MANRRARSWVPIVVVVLAFGLVVVIALGALGTVFVMRHVNVGTTSPDRARSEFDEARRKFAGYQPSIELSEDGLTLRELKQDRPPAKGKAHTLHVMAWDPDDERIVRVEIPMWLVRLKGSMPGLTIVEIGQQLTLEDIDRLSPGLLLDHETPGGQRVLMWTE